MAVGVGNAESEWPGVAAQRGLQAVVVRIGDVLQREDLSQAGRKCAQAVGIGKVFSRRAKASRLQINEICIGVSPGRSAGIRWRNKSKLRAVVRIAESAGNGLTRRKSVGPWPKWVVRRHGRNELVDLKFGGEMRSLAADITKGCDGILGEFALHTQAPLLDVRPNALRRDGSDVQRKCSRRPAAHTHASNATVAAGMVLRHIQHEGRAAFERAGVGLITNSVMEKYSIAGADGSFAVPGIPGETDAGGGVNDLARHATIWNPVHAASLQAVCNSRVRVAEIYWDGGTWA